MSAPEPPPPPQAIRQLACGHLHYVVFPYGTALEMMFSILADIERDPPPCSVCIRAVAAQN